MANVERIFILLQAVIGILYLFYSTANGLTYIRWCLTSFQETQKCSKLTSKMNQKSIAAVDCVQSNEPTDCMSKILGGTADIIVLNSGLAYKAGKSFKMIPILYEDYDTDPGNGYYAVALVKKSEANVTLENLKDKNTCHAGVRTMAGWYLPMGYLMNKGYIKSDCKAGLISGGNFFNSSCAPDALSRINDPFKKNSESLCALCTGDGNKNCRENIGEPYYGNSGAFLCLANGDGDVAFLAHAAIMEMIGSASGKYGSSEDYELLCEDGTRKGVEEFSSCNLGYVPSNVLMTSSNKTNQEIQKYKDALKAAQSVFGPTSKDFNMFNSDDFGERDLMFSDNTKELKEVGEKSTYKKWLGDEMFNVIAETECHEKVNKVIKVKENGASSRELTVLYVVFVNCILHFL